MFTTTMHKARTIAALTLAAASIAGCRGTTSAKPPVHLNWNMDNQAYHRGQTPSDFFADGAASRLPVENTIAIGELRDNEALETGHVDGKYLTELPEGIELNEALLARGEARFDIYCAPCHGTTGSGHGAVPARAASAGATWIVPSFHDEQRQGYPVGRIFNVATEGFATMPSYRSQIPAEDRWAIAAWVKALQLTQEASAEGGN